MINKRFALRLFLLLSLCTQVVSAQYSFIKHFELPNNSDVTGQLVKVLQTKDRGFLIGIDYCPGGNCTSGSSVLMTKTDSLGNILWTNRSLVNYTDEPKFRDFVELPDSGFMFLGLSSTGTNRGILLIRTDKNGGLQYSKKIYSTGNFPLINEIKLLNDSTLIISGHYVFGLIRGCGYLTTDFSGNILINNFYTICNSDPVSSGTYGTLIKSHDGGYIISFLNQRNDSMPPAQYLPVILKTDSLGNVLWSHQFNHPIGSLGANPFKQSLLELDDGSIIVCGWWILPAGINTILSGTMMLKISSTGQLLTSKRFHPVILSPQLVLKDTNEILLTGTIATGNVWYITTSATFDTSLNFLSASTHYPFNTNLTWFNSSSVYNSSELMNVTPNLQGNKIYLHRSNFGDTLNCYQQPLSLIDSSIVFTDSTGSTVYNLTFNTIPFQLNVTADTTVAMLDWCTPLSIQEHDVGNNLLKVFPVPANEYVVVQTNSDEEKDIVLYDYTGKVVFKKSSNEKETIIDVQNLKPGIYLLKMTGRTNTWSRKLIVQHN